MAKKTRSDYRNNWDENVVVTFRDKQVIPTKILVRADIARRLGVSDRKFQITDRVMTMPKALALFMMEHQVYRSMIDGEPQPVVDVVEPTPEPTPEPVETTEETKSAEPVEIDATASAIELASEAGIDLSTINGSGKNGRITKGDVVSRIEG